MKLTPEMLKELTKGYKTPEELSTLYTMLELISTLFEAISGYFIGRFRATRSVATHISLIAISVALGISFFFVFGAYELIFPSPNPIGNVWIGLLCFSLGISFVTYLILLIGYLIKLRKKDN